MSERSPEASPRSTSGWKLLAGVLGIEAVGALALAVVTVVGAFGAINEPLGPVLSILIVGLVASAWVLVTSVGVFRQRAWARGSALTLQILMLVLALGAFQGVFGTPVVGLGFLAVGLLGFVAALRIRPVEHLPEGAEPAGE